MIAAGALWLRPRAVLAWLTLLYPPLVFVVILGTGNHYVLDTSSERRAWGQASRLRLRSTDRPPAARRARAGCASRSREQASGSSRFSSTEVSSESLYERSQRSHPRTASALRGPLACERRAHSARVDSRARARPGGIARLLRSARRNQRRRRARAGARPLARPPRAHAGDRARERRAGSDHRPPRARDARELGLHLGALAADRRQRRVALPAASRGVPPHAHRDLRLGRDRHDHLPRLPGRSAPPHRGRSHGHRDELLARVSRPAAAVVDGSVRGACRACTSAGISSWA